MANYPTFPITPRMAGHNFLNSEGTASQNIITGGDNGTRVKSLLFFDDTATARIAAVDLTNGTATYRLAAVTVNANANVTESLMDLDLPVDAHNNKYITLPDNTWSVAVTLTVAAAADNDVHVVAFAEDF